MSSPKTSEELTTDRELANLARVVFPGGTAKRLARAMRRNLHTVRFWLHHNFSRAAMRKAAAVLLVELDRQDQERAHAKERLREIAGGEWVGLSGNASEPPLDG